jgi:hypothetical protein
VTETAEPVCFTVHAKAHVLAALAAGEAAGRPVVVVSGPGASAYAGAAWFLAMTRQAAAQFPEVRLTAMLDCSDRAGDAMTALKAGATDLIFTGHPEASRRLADVARQTGAQIHRSRPVSCDLLDRRDPGRAARDWAQAATQQKFATDGPNRL